jgi:hypothetical protein
MNLTSKYFCAVFVKVIFEFSFRYPLIAHELICHSSMLAEALVEGGWQQEQPEDADDQEDDDDDLSNDVDDDIEERDDTDTDEDQNEDDANNQDAV